MHFCKWHFETLETVHALWRDSDTVWINYIILPYIRQSLLRVVFVLRGSTVVC